LQSNKGGFMSSISVGTTTTTGYVVTSDSTGALVLKTGASATTAVTIDTSQNVGIGTGSPAYKLDVSGSVRLKTGATGTPVIVSTGSDTQGTLRFGSSSTEYSINSGADYLAMIFNTNGSERARIDSSGNLLVGTTSPTYNASGRGLVEINGSSTSLLALKTGGNAAGYVYHDGTEMSVVNTRAGSLQLSTNGAERARITSAGNFGIGTTSPSGRLEVSKSGPSLIYNKETSVGVTSVWNSSDGSIVLFGTESNHPLLFVTNNTERARIDTSGNFGIGTTSPSSFGKLAVNVGQGIGFSTDQFGNALMTSGTSANQGFGLNIQVGNPGSLSLTRGASINLYGNTQDLPTTVGLAGSVVIATSSDAAITSANGNNIYFRYGSAELARITSSGKFLLGATSGGGELSFKDVTGVKIQFNASADNSYAISKLAGGGTLGDGEYRFTAGNTSAGAFTFSSGGSERVRITSGGNFGIGTSTPQYRLSLGNATGRKLAVYDDGTSGGVAAGFGTDLSGSGYELSAWSGAPGGGNGIFTFGQVNTTNGAFTERLRVNTGGQLTLPYQPAFMATEQAIEFTPGTGTYIYGAVKLNRGSHYNSGNGRFTAPVTGVYYFCHQTSGRPVSSTTYEPKIYVNGVEFSRAFVNGVGYGPNGTTTLTISLSANDYVEAGFYNGASPPVVLSGSNDINTSSNGIVSGFMGWLLG